MVISIPEMRAMDAARFLEVLATLDFGKEVEVNVLIPEVGRMVLKLHFLNGRSERLFHQSMHNGMLSTLRIKELDEMERTD